MYSGSSEQYWNKRKKTNPFKIRAMALTGFIALCLIVSTSRSRSRKRYEVEQRRRALELSHRPMATENHISLCESNMRDALRIECDELCSSEIASIPRPTMYQSCHHGCSRAFYSAAVVGCREGTEEDAFRKINAEGHNSCSRYANVDPRPDVQSTCKKYHRDGTKRGWHMGTEFIDSILNAEWNKRKADTEATYGTTNL